MPDDKPTSDWTEAERQAWKLAALIDAAADELERKGAVSPDEVRRRLEALEAEWAAGGMDNPSSGEVGHRPR